MFWGQRKVLCWPGFPLGLVILGVCRLDFWMGVDGIRYGGLIKSTMESKMESKMKSKIKSKVAINFCAEQGGG